MGTAVGNKLPIADMVQFRLDPKSDFAARFIHGQPSTAMNYEGWGAFSDETPLGRTELGVLCDAFPPPCLIWQPSGWVPTVEYTCHFRSLRSKPSSPWVRLRSTTTIVMNGLLETTTQAWAEDGSQLLAEGRQLARIWNPSATGIDSTT